jgi:hypothetical protein
MTKKQENKRTMYGAVTATLTANTEAIATVPALLSAKADFDSLVKQIDERDRQKEEALAGKKATKYQAKDDLIAAAVKTSAAVVAYACKNKNNELRDRVETTPTHLKQGRDTELVNTVTAIHVAAQEVIAKLADYGINEHSQADLSGKIAAFDDAIKNREAGIADRSAAGIDLSKLFDAADALLKEQLDKLIELVKANHEMFYNSYQAARVIKDLGIGSKERKPPLIKSETSIS